MSCKRRSKNSYKHIGDPAQTNTGHTGKCLLRDKLSKQEVQVFLFTDYRIHRKQNHKLI